MKGVSTTDCKIEQFKGYPFLMVGKNNRFRDKVDEYLYKQNIKPNILLEAENIETLLELCIKEMGLTFYEDLFIRRRYQSFNEKVAVLPLEDINSEMVAIGYYTPRYLTFAAKEFIRMAKELL
ncbi:LysR family transcriptional regulator substrate-binding protein [Clostridium sp. PL3]|uniref:LysR family transcriptional regulator substrate-binding protein n=1 Tax=Clostridium thailandense TaxID=2794346 RepID=A0A949WSG4_9CLOT|nr:LysR family transcriptional regulator substrate-binding protein [Clostridium thailandense]MBV7275150.1 LysR family transcriptional regulator substrate-binding protein [Clostridium thailandense]